MFTEQNRKMVVRVAKRHGFSDEDADDIAQVVFEKVLKRIEKGGFVQQGQGISYLYHTTLTACADRKRGRGRLEDPTANPIVQGVVEPRSADELALYEALEALPAVFRDTLLLNVVEGHSASEVGQLLSIPIGTVLSRLSRGRARCRAILCDGV